MIDYVGQWFKIYRELLEPTEIFFVLEKDGLHTAYLIDHSDMDGSGAVFDIAKKNGFAVTVNDKIIRSQPSRFRYLLNILLFPFWARPRGNKLWNFAYEKCTNTTTIQSWLKLQDYETAQLKNIAHQNGVSLNTYLLYHLDSVIGQKFTLLEKPRSWWIPVNMRSDLGLNVNDATIKKNYVSNFNLDLSASESAKTIQSKITSCLKQKRHWGTWWWQLIGRYLPSSSVKSIAKKRLYNNFYVGAFTNLGEWQSSDPTITLSVAGNPLLSHPFCATAIIFNGGLNLSIRIYPTFPLSQSELDTLIRNWKTCLFAI